MSVTIRMSRMGTKKKAFYRIVVATTRSKRDGAQLDTLGYYRPGMAPKEAVVNLVRTQEWIKKGALVSPTVARLLKKAEESVKNGGNPEEIKLALGEVKTKKTHKERLAAKKKDKK